MAKKETNKKENSKNKRSFFKDFKAELKKVVWPTPKQLVNNTVAVVTIVLITAAIVFVLDLAFEAVNKQGVEKIKEIITPTSENAAVEQNTTIEENNEESENINTEETIEGQEQVEEQEVTEDNAE